MLAFIVGIICGMAAIIVLSALWIAGECDKIEEFNFEERENNDTRHNG